MIFSYAYLENDKVVGFRHEIDTSSFYPLSIKQEIFKTIRKFILDKELENKEIYFLLFPETQEEWYCFESSVENWFWKPNIQTFIKATKTKRNQNIESKNFRQRSGIRSKNEKNSINGKEKRIKNGIKK